MRVLVVDDEQPARERLVHMLKDMGRFEAVGEADNGMTALRMVDSRHPDVVLMDIRMPGMDGLEAARHLGAMDEPPAIIFTTAYSEHALEAFETHALGYLVKPIRQEKLAQALTQASRLTQAQLVGLRQSENAGRSHICARMRGNLELIPIGDVIYFQADQKYITVRHVKGHVLIEEVLKDLAVEFGEKFIRIHRNAIVNKEFLAGMEKDRQREAHFFASFKGIDDRLEISRRHVAETRRILKQL